MLPVEPNDEIDRDFSAGGSYPDGDETARNDGWAAFSGTSAAAPQLAGICALIKQACPDLSPYIYGRYKNPRCKLRKVLYEDRRTSCEAGPDLATGAGLADVSEAVREARDLC